MKIDIRQLILFLVCHALLISGCASTADKATSQGSTSSDKSQIRVALKDVKSSCEAEWSWANFGCNLTKNTCSGTPDYGWSVFEGCSCVCPENICHWKPQDCSFVKGGEPRCSKVVEGPPACITYDCRKCPDGKLYGFSYSEMVSWCDGENYYPCE